MEYSFNNNWKVLKLFANLFLLHRIENTLLN